VAAIDELAPDFTLQDQEKRPVTLSALRGAPVLLVFYPLAFSGTCTTEMCAIRDDWGAFQQRGARVLGISVDSTHALAAWRREQGFAHDFLSDRWPTGAVAKLYGTWNEEAGYADRSSFLVDADGVVRATWRTVGPVARELQAYLDALDRLAPAGA
jgi:peroxiredoxin